MAGRDRPDGDTVVVTMTDLVVPTTTGPIRGRERRGVQCFRGIPYAEARRFAPPHRPEPWTTPHDATRPGPIAPQIIGPVEMAMGGAQVPSAEDCLRLNVWTPSCDDARRPVLVWIHGGAFTAGSSTTPWFDGSAFAGNDTVLVSCNYRLGALGFAYLAGISDDERFAHTGNLGSLDQVAALEWVRDNIAAFGGDPTNVTIFGESAGGASVVTLLSMPAAEGLFHRAIAQSPSIIQLRSTDTATERARDWLAAHGIGHEQLHDLIDAEVELLLASQAKVNLVDGFAPTTGALALPHHPEVATAAVPLIMGTNADEMRLFTLIDPQYNDLDRAGLIALATRTIGERGGILAERYLDLLPQLTPSDVAVTLASDHMFTTPVRRVAEARALAGAPTWLYRFTWATPAYGGLLRSCHGLEIPFVFDNLGEAGVNLFTGDDAPQALADEMHGQWLSFARGAPPDWPAYDLDRRATARYDVDSEVVLDPDAELRQAWEDVAS